MSIEEEFRARAQPEDDDVVLPDPERNHAWQRWPYRVLFALLALGFVVLVGGIAIYISGEGEYSFIQAAYFSLITVSTVGFGELPHMADHPWARVISGFTIVTGLIVLSLFQSTLTALFVEGVVGRAVRRRRMNQAISKLENHYILVGSGRVGRYVAEDLYRMGYQFVIIEQNPAAVRHVESELHTEVLHVEGSATDDDVLLAAGIERALGLVTTLSLDRDNLFVTLSARTMNPKLRILSKVVNSTNEAKFLRAGASATVSPQSIGGRRLAQDLVRPQATAFFESMMQVPKGIGFHDIFLNHGSFLSGKTLREAGLREVYDLLVVGFLREDDQYDYNPPGDASLVPGSHLVVLGHQEDAQRLRKDLAGKLDAPITR
jgi:voltage-gated potassium channel